MSEIDDPIFIINKKGKKTILDENLVKILTEELLDWMMEDTRRVKDFGKSSTLIKTLIELKKAYWPALTKQVTADMTVPFEKQVEQFLALKKEARALAKIEKDK